MNFIKQLDTFALGSRLKNFTEILFKDVKKIYKDQGVNFEPRWFTTIYLLSEKGKLSVTEIANEICQTHPSVNQIVNSIEKQGLIDSLKDKSDSRKRILSLNNKGRRLVKRLKPLWINIDIAASNFLNENQADFLQIISKMENALEEKSMYKRVTEQIKRAQYSEIEILEYSSEYKKHFKDLNYQWLEKYFNIEENDKKLLLNPEMEIIDKGGAILFAKYNDEIVGTAAIIKFNENECELAKMAVKIEHQGKQIGHKLLNEVIEKSKEMDFKKIFLLTSTKLTKAVSLYKSVGFILVNPTGSQIRNYKRKTIMMEMNI